MTLTEQQVREILAPCPFCGERLEVRTSKNPYGRHAQDSECIIGRMAVSIPTDVEDWNRRAADAAVRDAPKVGPEREHGVTEIVMEYRDFINERPELLSLLYDIDMLPEQCVTRAGAIRLSGLCEVWKRMESAEIALKS